MLLTTRQTSNGGERPEDTRGTRVWHGQEYKAGSEALTQYNYASQGPRATGNRVAM
jgi:hypothetical protein